MTQAVPQLNYTTINHQARMALRLSILDYCVFDLIHHLATNPKNNQFGWCYAKKETIAGYLAINRATVFRAIKKGLAAGLLEKHPEQPALLKATRSWYETVRITRESQSATGHRIVQPPSSHDATATSRNIRRYKDTDKNSDKKTVEAAQEKQINGFSIGALLRHYPLPRKDD